MHLLVPNLHSSIRYKLDFNLYYTYTKIENRKKYYFLVNLGLLARITELSLPKFSKTLVKSKV